MSCAFSLIFVPDTAKIHWNEKKKRKTTVHTSFTAQPDNSIGPRAPLGWKILLGIPDTPETLATVGVYCQKAVIDHRIRICQRHCDRIR